MNKERFISAQVKNAFSAAAQQYDNYAQLQQEVMEFAVSMATPCWEKGAKILDLGCGTGTFARMCKDQSLGWYITGLDISPGMCAIAKEACDEIITASAESIPCADNSFDGAFSSLMLQWSNNPLQAFKELARVVKPGGRCIISTFTHGTLDELRESFAALDDGVHVNDFGPSNYFSAHAAHSGLKVLASEEEVITEYYESSMDLMRTLKAIGATVKQQGAAKKGLMTPRKLKQLEQEYRNRFAHEDGLPATWHVMYMQLEKA